MAHIALEVIAISAEVNKHEHVHPARIWRNIFDLPGDPWEEIQEEYNAKQAKKWAECKSEYERICFLHKPDDVGQQCKKWYKNESQTAWEWHQEMDRVNRYYFIEMKKPEQEPASIVQLIKSDIKGHQLVHRHVIRPIHSSWQDTLGKFTQGHMTCSACIYLESKT